MRELRILNWCDVCAADDGADPEMVEATEVITLGAVRSESKPGLTVLDLCQGHADALMDAVGPWLAAGRPLTVDAKGKPVAGPPRALRDPATAVAAHARPDWSTWLPPDAPRKNPMDKEKCPICEIILARAGMITHVWKVHRGVRRPAQPTRCPECHRHFGNSGMAIHRIRAHGYDPLVEAIGESPVGQPQLALTNGEHR